ncbi:MAG: tRNA-dihydrouridine synthase B, partial [Thermoproteota archaeon]
VRKVVTKGGGSALLKEPKLLIPFLKEIKSAIDIPLTIKIRTGWDNENVNASEIVKVAADCGVEFVAIHGRTRTQQYTGKANWEYLESLNDIKEIPLVGNGDLHQPAQVIKRMKNTKMDALMIARGAIRNPFIFLESYQGLDAKQSLFSGEEYWEVIQRLYIYTTDAFSDERICLVQMRKLIVWFAAGFKGAAKFRGLIFATKTLPDCMKVTEDYFLSLDSVHKYINYDEVFMSSGHG